MKLIHDLNRARKRPAFEDSVPYEQLPRDIPHPFSLIKLSTLIVGMFLVVVIVNIMMIGFLGQYTTNFGYFLNYQKWQMLKNLDSQVEWLILGDSSVNQGIDPSIFKDELGERAINLGTIGNMITLDDLWMLEYYINKFGPPENIIIAHVFDVWYRDFNPVLLGQIPLSWGFWKEFSATQTLVWNREIQRDIFLERYVPIYSQTSTLGGIIQDTFLKLSNPFQSDWQLNPNGYFPAQQPAPDIVVADAQNKLVFVREKPFKLSDLNQRALSEIQRLAEEHGIKVYLVLGPQYEGLRGEQDFREYLDSVREQLNSYASQSEFVNFISEIKTFPANQMQNFDHLIDSGAREYTNWLIEHIKQLR